MISIQLYNNEVALSEIRTTLEETLTTKIKAGQKVFESLARRGNPFGSHAHSERTYPNGSQFPAREPMPIIPFREDAAGPAAPRFPNRYSVVYLLKEQYQHLGCSTHAEAQAALETLLDDTDRIPVGIYDDRTELFEWDAALRDEYEKASMKDQGRHGEQIITIAQALRRRDLSWDGELKHRSFFA